MRNAAVESGAQVPGRISTLPGETARQALAAAIDAKARRSPRRAGLVLMYHDVAATSGDPERCVVPPLAAELLRAQLAHLRRRYDVGPLPELQKRATSRVAGGRFPVALTFDDDLESHSTFVAPLLAEFESPATFFLTGSSLDGSHAFWWHDLNDVFARGGKAWQEVAAEAARRWGSTGRELALHDLARTFEMLPPSERDAFAWRLREIAASPPREPGLSEGAVRELASAGFDIGFHTASHYHLQTLDDGALHSALREGADRLAAIAGYRMTSIAYPYGRADLRIAAAAADAGFEIGVIWSDQRVDASSHPLLLARVDGWQPSAGSFAFRLARIIFAGA